MFAGHFGLAAAVKARTQKIPIWALMLSTQLLDVLFVIFYLSGVETIEPAAGNGYGESLIHADYTHSLAGALIIALAAGILSARFWGTRAGRIIASVVFSHWILDLIVHRMDLPVLPGNIGGLPLLGFGIWKYPVVSMALEGSLIVVGFIMYFRSAVAQAAPGRRMWAYVAGGVLGILLSLSLITDVFGIG